jgi:PII-like signaling protein
MENILTFQQVLELIREQSIVFNQNLERERLERELSNKKFNENFEKSRTEFDKKLGEITGTWGKFVAEMVKPKIVDLFKEKGIQIRTSMQQIEGFIGEERHYEIDLLLINSNVAVVVEIKSTLSKEDIDEHLKRLDKIKTVPPERVNLSGVTVFGAVAGMIVEQGADRYAYKKGLYVLRQKGNLVEIVNDDKFKPLEWKVEY